MLDRIRKQKQEKVAEKLPSGPLKVCEKKHGGNAMESLAGVCSPAGKLGFGRGNSTRGPAVCRGASNKYKFTRVGAVRPLSIAHRGRLCPLRCAPQSSGSLGVVHTDNLVDPADEGGDLDVHPRHVFSTAAESPRYEACELMVA